MTKKDLIKINDYLWEIPKSFRADMRVPARFYTSEKMLEDVLKDRSLEQLVNLCALPGIVKYGLAMPDIHEGYASPIGGVAAISAEDGIISPGMCGYDINCGMKLLRSEQTENEIRPHLEKLAGEIQKEVPSGLGRGRRVKLGISSLDKILESGARQVVEQGYGEKEDVENCESGGRLDWADASAVSGAAKQRGRDQVGTLGSGNHFLEIQKVDEIFDEKASEAFGLFEKQVVIMIHCGSRGLGHQVATDYIREFLPLMMQKYKNLFVPRNTAGDSQKPDSRFARNRIRVPDQEFACVPFGSPEGQRYFAAMAASANYAWANRQTIAHFVRQAWKNVLGSSTGSGFKVVYDVAHNIIKTEDYRLPIKDYGKDDGFDGKRAVSDSRSTVVKLAVHRKGATRAFPLGHPEVPEKYRNIGQPVLIPGSMGTASYVLRGAAEAEQSFYSTCHGAGRTMSRHQAMRTVSGEEVIRELQKKGIIVKCYSRRGIAEEAPLAYKNIDSVVEVVHRAGLSKKVARLVPLAVIKGE
ncbi:MAG: RtcB family protein [Candidatus Portnoybacteria bacterium]|nr:RtcB family protein [Candidatus Portnoybacteria bacterium]